MRARPALRERLRRIVNEGPAGAGTPRVRAWLDCLRGRLARADGSAADVPTALRTALDIEESTTPADTVWCAELGGELCHLLREEGRVDEAVGVVHTLQARGGDEPALRQWVARELSRCLAAADDEPHPDLAAEALAAWQTWIGARRIDPESLRADPDLITAWEHPLFQNWRDTLYDRGFPQQPFAVESPGGESGPWPEKRATFAFQGSSLTTDH